MPRFLTRLIADSTIRLNRRAYRLESEVTSFVFPFPQGKVAVVDKFISIGSEWVPDGIAIQVEFEATDITTAVEESRARALPVLSLLSLTAGGAVNVPLPLWSYEVTQGVTDRQWRYLAYDHRLGLRSRPVEQTELGEIWAKLDKFQNREDIKIDFKLRVIAAIHSYRRALSDNDDLLSEFLVVWPNLEGLDCVYRKVFPAPKAEEQDGIRDIFNRLGRPDSFKELKSLRHGLAHGFIDLRQATATATANIDLVRAALKLMVSRIIGCEESFCEEVIKRPPLKGKYPPHLRCVGTIQMDTVDVSDFGNQPHVEPDYGGEIKTERDGDRLTISPAMNFRLHKSGATLTIAGYEVWGDRNSPLVVTQGAIAKVIHGSALQDG